MKNRKYLRRQRIKRSVRKKVSGTAVRPRMSVFKSNTSIYVQLIDDVEGVTLASASSKELSDTKSVNIELAKQVGEKIAEKAKDKGVDAVVFDRNGYLYHGRVKALTDGAREKGLQF